MKSHLDLPQSTTAEPPISCVRERLTQSEYTEDFELFTKFFEEYCTDTDDTTVLSCTEIEGTVLAVGHQTDLPLADSEGYRVTQYDTATHFMTSWRVSSVRIWHPENYSFERINDRFRCELSIHSTERDAKIQLSQSGMTWHEDAHRQEIVPRHCPSPLEMAYTLAKRIKT